MIKIEVSRRDVAWLLRPLQEFPKECQGAMWQAVKRSLSTARKEMTEEISALAYLKRSVIPGTPFNLSRCTARNGPSMTAVTRWPTRTRFSASSG